MYKLHLSNLTPIELTVDELKNVSVFSDGYKLKIGEDFEIGPMFVKVFATKIEAYDYQLRGAAALLEFYQSRVSELEGLIDKEKILS